MAMMELKLRFESQSFDNCPKLFNEFSSVSGIIDPTNPDKNRIYFKCDIEKPVRWFVFTSNSPTYKYITCNIFIHGMHIVAVPIATTPICEALESKHIDITKKKKVTTDAYIVNQEFPKNEQPITLEFIICKYANGTYYVEAVQFYLDKLKVVNEEFIEVEKNTEMTPVNENES